MTETSVYAAHTHLTLLTTHQTTLSLVKTESNIVFLCQSGQTKLFHARDASGLVLHMAVFTIFQSTASNRLACIFPYYYVVLCQSNSDTIMSFLISGCI